jgi:hypothetical protein
MELEFLILYLLGSIKMNKNSADSLKKVFNTLKKKHKKLLNESKAVNNLDDLLIKSHYLHGLDVDSLNDLQKFLLCELILNIMKY